MIVYKFKNQNGYVMWQCRPVKIRRVDKRARLDKKLRTYRRLWWWDERRWNQRHGWITEE